MSTTSEIDNVIENLEQGYAEQKEASRNAAPDTSSTTKEASNEPDVSGEEINSFLESMVNGEDATTKTASNESGETVEGGIDKIASELAEADMTATMAEGRMFGSAMFDEFISKANKYAQYAAQSNQGNGGQTKQASAQRQRTKQAELQQIKQAGLEQGNKVGQAISQQIKQARHQAQQADPHAQEKQAGFEMGQKVAAQMKDGQNNQGQVTKEAAYQAEQQGKQAALQDVAEAAEKCFNSGAADVAHVLNKRQQ